VGKKTHERERPQIKVEATGTGRVVLFTIRFPKGQGRLGGGALLRGDLKSEGSKQKGRRKEEWKEPTWPKSKKKKKKRKDKKRNSGAVRTLLINFSTWVGITWG